MSDIQNNKLKLGAAQFLLPENKEHILNQQVVVVLFLITLRMDIVMMKITMRIQTLLPHGHFVI